MADQWSFKWPHLIWTQSPTDWPALELTLTTDSNKRGPVHQLPEARGVVNVDNEAVLVVNVDNVIPNSLHLQQMSSMLSWSRTGVNWNNAIVSHNYLISSSPHVVCQRLDYWRKLPWSHLLIPFTTTLFNDVFSFVLFIWKFSVLKDKHVRPGFKTKKNEAFSEKQLFLICDSGFAEANKI